MPAWIDAWQETLRVQRNTLRQTARKKALPHWSAEGIFRETSHPAEGRARGASGPRGREAKQRSREAFPRHSEVSGTGYGAGCDSDATELQDEEGDEDDDDEWWDDGRDPRRIFEAKLVRQSKGPARNGNGAKWARVSQQPGPARKAAFVPMPPLESTSTTAFHMANSIRDELLSFCKTLHLEPPVSGLQVAPSLHMPMPNPSYDKPALSDTDIRAKPRKRMDLASQLRDHTLSRARQKLQSRRSASVQTAPVYDTGQQLDQTHVITACGRRAGALLESAGLHKTDHGDGSGQTDGSPAAYPNASQDVLEDRSWGEIVVQGVRPESRVREAREWPSPDTVASQSSALPAQSCWILGTAMESAGSPDNASKQLAPEPLHAEEVQEQESTAQRFLEPAQQHTSAMMTRKHRLVRGFGHEPSVVPVQKPPKDSWTSMVGQSIGSLSGPGLYDVSVREALRRKARRQTGEPSGAVPDSCPMAALSNLQSVPAADAGVEVVTEVSPAALSHQVSGAFGHDSFKAGATPEDVLPEPGEGQVQHIPEASPATTTACHARAYDELGTDDFASTYREDVPEESVGPHFEPEAQDSNASDPEVWTAPPLTPTFSEDLEELPPLPPYRPLPSLSEPQPPPAAPLVAADWTGPRLAAKDLEDRFYGSLQVLDSVQEHLSVVDLLASQKALQEEQRRSVAARLRKFS